MENYAAGSLPEQEKLFGKMQVLFTKQLNDIYCAKSHITERLASVCQNHLFNSLELTINDVIWEAEEQLERLGKIYELLNERNTFYKCEGLILFLENMLCSVSHPVNDFGTSYLLMLTYLEHVKSLENSASRSLQSIAIKFNQDRVLVLLNEPYNKAMNLLIREIGELFEIQSY